MLNCFQEEVANIYVIAIITFSILIYNLITYFNFYRKKKKILNSNKLYIPNNKFIFLNSYLNKIENKLFNLGFPYKITTKKYLIIKYGLSLFLSLVAFLSYKSIKALLIFYLITFFLPDYLIHIFKNKEKNILINEIKSLTSNMILVLSAYGTIEQALEISKNTLVYERFIQAYERFIYEYKMNGYNIRLASIKLEKEFSSYELNLFISTLIQGEKEGNLLENLDKLSETLELNYFKYLKKKSKERLLYVTLGTVISLINIILVVMYPMFKQVIDNLQIIFS